MPTLGLIFILIFLLSTYSYNLPLLEYYLSYLASRDFPSFFITIAVCRKDVLDFIE